MKLQSSNFIENIREVYKKLQTSLLSLVKEEISLNKKNKKIFSDIIEFD